MNRRKTTYCCMAVLLGLLLWCLLRPTRPSARLDALEKRLDELTPAFNERIEKAAASAAARILREEIARLLQG